VTSATRWDEYVSTNLLTVDLARCSQIFTPALSAHRERIVSLLETLQPRRVVVMGSGYLNDISLDALFGASDGLFLVDWIPHLAVEGVRSNVIGVSGDQSECLACMQGINALSYCASFHEAATNGHCVNFVAHETSAGGCVSYTPGDGPRFLVADVTSGRASRFAQSVESVLKSSKTPIEAIRKALVEAKRFSSTVTPLEIEDHSVDFVTSSMVASQFDVEPWTFFLTALEERFGRERLMADEERFAPAGEKLGSLLFETLVDGHLREMSRLLKPDGRAYVSLELFRSSQGRDQFFPVVSRLIDLAKPYFVFDFEQLDLADTLEEIEIGDDHSVVASFLMRPHREESS
jgi:hypothetical protein